jgi:WD40 repeat protein
MKLTLLHKHTLATGVLGLAITPDGTRGFAACVDGLVSSVDLVTGEAEALTAKHDSYASGCVLLPDGRTVISGGYDGQLLWHDLESRQEVRRVQAHGFWSWKLALSPDGRRVATSTGQYRAGGWKYEPAAETEPSVKVFDTASGELVAAFSHMPPVLSCGFSRDGLHLAAANMLGEVRVWDLAAGADATPVAQWTSPDFTSWGTTKSHHYCGGIYALAFSPDDRSLLGCGMGPMVDPMAGNGKMTWQRWDWRTGERIDQIKDAQHGTGLMEALAWSPDGTHFVMAGRQAQGTWNAAIFSAADGSLVHSEDAKNRITQARFSADGQQLILAGATAQPQPKAGEWPSWGRVQVYRVEA